AAPDSLSRLGAELAQLYGDVQGSDAAPTPQIEAAVSDRLRLLDALLGARASGRSRGP
ncbi:MAG: hypothetical protein HOQ30_00130, partial [Gemmatimonadaceae bacterium]|nr:hypothetical protein [Gemmatimonadaceae bacterium]